MIQAKRDGNRIICGACGALLAIEQETVVTGEDWAKDNLEFINIRRGIEIKCKHKSAGKYCNTVNEILL